MQNASTAPMVQKEKKTEEKWKFNFFLLWQGRFVSALGDVAYEIALGFWVLAITNSTAIMGLLMAASTIPRILISPFAGVIVDRVDRKKLLIWMDLIRGVTIVGVSIAIFSGYSQVWIVFGAGIVLGVCASFFNPSILSTIPDVVPSDRLVKANSLFGMIQAISRILGNTLGGILYQVIGAPLLFLLNGLSYLISSITELFIKVPKVIHQEENQEFTFTSDLKKGFKFVMENAGLKSLILMMSSLTFFSNMAIILILPLFQSTEGLGAGKYGITMAFFTIGILLGNVYFSIFNVSTESKVKVFRLSAIVSTLAGAFFPLMNNFVLMLVLIWLGGFFNAFVTVLLNSSIQKIVPQNMRGKVLALLSSLLSVLTPVSMAIGGIIGEIYPLKIIVSACFLINFAIFLSFTFSKAVKSVIAYEPSTG